MTGSCVMKETGCYHTSEKMSRATNSSSFCPSLGPIDYTNNRLKVSNCHGFFCLSCKACNYFTPSGLLAFEALNPFACLKPLSVYCNRQLETIKIVYLIHTMTYKFRQIHLACNIFFWFQYNISSQF